MKFFYTYILISLADRKFYIGYTENVHKRLDQHNNGENQSTKSRLPFELLYFEAHRSKQDALRRESYFKTTSGKRTLRNMLKESLADIDNIK